MEQLLIQRLRGVDVMVAGGSGASFFDDGSTTSTEDDVFATQNADGDPAYVVSVPGLYSKVGVVDLQFDNNGIPSIVRARGLESTQDTVNAVGGDLNGQAASLVSDLVEAVQDVVFEKDQIIYGYTDTYLQGNRAFIRTEETNFGNLAADSQLWKAQQIDPEITVSLKNGGGLRAAIGDIGGTAENPVLLPPRARTIAEDGYFKPEGAISQLDLENTLRFNNDLVVVETTAAGLQALMEHAISASATGNTPGQFAQIGGMRLQFDYEQDYSDAPGRQRIRSLVITGENDSIIDVIIQDGELQGSPDRPIKMVTLDFLANNDGDSYPFSEVASSITNLQINGNDVSEQVALAEYLQAFYGTPETAFNIAETSVENDLRIINNGRGNRNTILNDAPIELRADLWVDQVTGQHLYVTTRQEGSSLLGNPNWEQSQESINWLSSGDESSTLSNINRLYNPESGDHLYTINPTETTLALNELGYVLEGVVGRAYSTPTEGADAIYRFYNQGIGTHAFGESPSSFGEGWTNEGIALFS
ncbi:MAG: 5'-nucleotidase C-terminal domain-containing protein [Synechococcus sp.]